MVRWSRAGHAAKPAVDAHRPPRILPALLSVVAIVFTVLVAELLFLSALSSRVERIDVALPGSAEGGTTYLLVGSDSRDFVESSKDLRSFGDTEIAPGARADMLALLRVPDEGDPILLTVPRDLVVEIPAWGENRLAMAFFFGPQDLVDTFCESLGVGVDHLLIMDFDGFRDLVDELGGVEVRTKYPIRDPATGLEFLTGGTRQVDGEQALAYVRSRRSEVFVDGEWQSQNRGGLLRGERALDVAGEIGDALQPSLLNPLRSHVVAWRSADKVVADEATGVFDLRAAAQAVGDPDREVVSLPVEFADGEVPRAVLGAEGAEVLSALSGASGTCRL